MLPVALERQNAAERSLAKGAASGVAAAFSKKGFQVVDETFVAMEGAIRDAQRVGRGGKALAATGGAAQDAKALDDAFGGLSKARGRGKR